MPIVVGESKDRIAELIGELVDKLDEHISTPPEPPVVNVEPVIHINPTSVTVPAPVVNVSPARGSWVFTIHRDADDNIKTITVDPK